MSIRRSSSYTSIVDIMKAQFGIKALVYLIIALGCVLAFTTAVVPHYEAGHKLLASVFIASLIPYIIYGALMEVLRDKVLSIVGILIIAIDLLLKLPLRFSSSGVGDGATMMYASFALAIIPLGALLWARQVRPASGNRKD